MKAKPHRPQHATDHHVAPNPTPKRTTVQKRSNAEAGKGTGLPTQGGPAMDRKHC